MKITIELTTDDDADMLVMDELYNLAKDKKWNKKTSMVVIWRK